MDDNLYNLAQIKEALRDTYGYESWDAVVVRLHEIVQRGYDETQRRKNNFLMKQIKLGNLVWCRNGWYAHLATPCSEVACLYKRKFDDVYNGCIKCNNYVITVQGNWDCAKKINYNGE